MSFNQHLGKTNSPEVKKVNQRMVMDVITAYQTHINDFVNVSSRDLKNIMELIATKNDVRRRRYS